MKILFFSDNFAPECCAPAIHVYERAGLWVQWGHEVTVITGSPNWPEGKLYEGYENRWRAVEMVEGIRVVRVKTFIAANAGFLLRTIDYMSYVLPAFITALREARPDVVISTSPQLFTPVAGVGYARLMGIPHVFELRDLWPASIVATGAMKAGLVYRLLERLELSLYRKSTRVLSITNSYVDDLTGRGIAPEKIDVVRNGANLQLFYPRAKDPETERTLNLQGRFVVGYLGTLGLAHGLENALEAAAMLRDAPVTFLFVGTGAAKAQLELMARERGLDNVIFIHRQSHVEMAKYWSVCDAALVHTRASALFKGVIPSKIYESMAMGLPIIYVGLQGEASGIVDAHDCGVVIAPECPISLRDVVLSLVGDRQLSSRLGHNGFKAAHLYSRENQALGTLQVLHKVAGGAGDSLVMANDQSNLIDRRAITSERVNQSGCEDPILGHGSRHEVQP